MRREILNELYVLKFIRPFAEREKPIEKNPGRGIDRQKAAENPARACARQPDRIVACCQSELLPCLHLNNDPELEVPALLLLV